MEWYSLRVISGKEMNAQEDIMREISDGGVVDEVIEVFVPYEKIQRARSQDPSPTMSKNYYKNSNYQNMCNSER